MLKTSFGEMEILFKQDNKPQVEYLRFVKSGRPHKHAEFESFFTLKGTGAVIAGEQRYTVKPGDLVTIPPDVPHWMEPDADSFLEGLLWYHQEPLNLPEGK
jgi:quercetin dioxygenase-like cupin family protein